MELGVSFSSKISLRETDAIWLHSGGIEEKTNEEGKKRKKLWTTENTLLVVSTQRVGEVAGGEEGAPVTAERRFAALYTRSQLDTGGTEIEN